MGEFSFKEIYDVVLKATYPIEIENKTILAGEVVAAFDKINLANFQEIKDSISANGGYQNKSLIIWQSTKELQLNFTQGIFSQAQLGLMYNSKMLENTGEDIVEIHQREEVTSDEDGSIIVKYSPVSDIYVYDENGDKVKIPSPLEVYEQSDGTWKVEIKGEPFKNYVVDYSFKYSGGTIMRIGNQLITGFLSFEGKTKVQDDISGNFRTGIIKIPKLKLMSGLSIRLGTESSPVVGSISAIGMPTGERGQEEVARIVFLNDDIDSDL